MGRVGANPRLYDADSDVPVLHGVRCSRCERVYFPPISIGCESCGAQDLVPANLAPSGTVFAAATVHLHPDDTPVPFTIVEVLLDSGPLIRALVHPEAGDPEIGSRVVGTWLITATDGENQTIEPAFIPAPSEEAR